MMKITIIFTLVALANFCDSTAHADLFGSGTNTVDIDFVTIGSPSNVADTTGDPNPAGKVDYTYRIGQFEISEGMIDKANALGGLGITHDNRGANKPASSISWFEAVSFVNWLNIDSGNTAAYKFDGGGNFQLWQSGDMGYDPNNLYRNSQAKYFLPSADEWYKAAYYDPSGGVYFNYPTGSDTAPSAVASGTAAGSAVYNQSTATGPADITLAGGLSPYGTMGQGGNVFEWEETDSDLVNDSSSIASRGVRGGSWNGSSPNLLPTLRGFGGPAFESYVLGFRVASTSVPEPSAAVGLSLIGLVVLTRRSRL